MSTIKTDYFKMAEGLLKEGLKAPDVQYDSDGEPIKVKKMSAAQAFAQPPVAQVSDKERKLGTALKEVGEKFRAALAGAESTIKEQADRIEQLEGSGMKLFGVAIEVNPDSFGVEDFPINSDVRVVRGQFAGSFGKTISEIDDDGMALIEIAGVKPMKMRFVRKFTNPTMWRSMSDTEPIENPDPAQYRIGAFIKNEAGDWLKVISEVDRSGEISIMRVSANGNMTDEMEVGSIFVGEDVLIAPGSRKAGFIFVALDGRIVECQIPRAFEVKRGHVVAINPQTLEIVSTSGMVSYGETVYFEQALIDGTCEVAVGSSQATKVVYSLVDPNTLKKGDRVCLDTTHQVIVRVLPRELKRNNYSGRTGVTWDDIGGLDDAKKALREAIEHPVRYADLFAHYGKKHTRGVLLYGPPGCGKTELARAASTAICEAHGGMGYESCFIYLKGPEVLSQWVGAAEAHVRQIFQAARDHHDKFGYPAIIFIDEADAILGRRGSMRSADVDKTIVPAFLAEWDGLDRTPFFVILATNRPDTLDPAVTRDGRVDRKVRITRPDTATALQIADIHLGDKPLSSDRRAVLAAVARGLFDPARTLAEIKFSKDEIVHLTLGHIISGAMIAGVVEKSCGLAIERDIESGTQSGISVEDIEAAIDITYSDNKDVNLDDDVADMIGPRTPLSVVRKMSYKI